jgi:hypothetical protein
MRLRHILVLSVLCLSAFPALAHRKDVVLIENPSVPLPEKEAILILPGFGSKIHGVKNIKKWFANKGYDVYIPHYIGRDSLQQCVLTVNAFIEKHQLLSYKKLHVFSYIAGSWVFNLWLLQHPANNVASVVYDRSPLQERAPYVLVKDNPFLIKLIAGKIMKNFASFPYPVVSNDQKNLGIMIENKATKLIRKHQKTALTLGPLHFNKDSLHQPCDDYLYECIDHDEMYYKLDVVGAEVLYFFRNGRFPPAAKKEARTYDYWDKRVANCGDKTPE